MTENRKPIRWWPVLVLAGLAAAGLVFIWFVQERPRQARYIRTAILLMSTFAGLLVWLLFFSRARWTWRVSGLGAVVLCLGAIAVVFEIRGVTGDLLPILEPRWKARQTVTASVEASGKAAAGAPPAGEFTGFYGPNRNATLPEARIETNWTAHPPEILWRQPVGAAWSGFAVKDGLAITQEQRDQQEHVVCYELLTGRMVWSQSNEGRYSTTIAGEGPRATPTIQSNRVYTFGATGILSCFDLRNGQRLWTKDTLKENEAEVPDWGTASSPLVIEGKVVVSTGGKNNRSIAAYSTETGEFIWGSGNAGADYSSPVAAEFHGTQQIIIFNSAGLMACDLGGTNLWNYRWPGGHPHISPPVVIAGNRLLVSSGYGTGAELLRISVKAGQWAAERIWKSLALKSKFGPIFVACEFVYGLDDGMFTCVELATGKRRWKDGRYGHGQGLLVGGTILLTSEKGELVLIEPNPDRLIELSRFKVFSDKTWNPPALAGEFLLVRNHKEAACLKLRVSGLTARVRWSGSLVL